MTEVFYRYSKRDEWIYYLTLADESARQCAETLRKRGWLVKLETHVMSHPSGSERTPAR
jgi:hypothetical protein